MAFTDRLSVSYLKDLIDSMGTRGFNEAFINHNTIYFVKKVEDKPTSIASLEDARKWYESEAKSENTTGGT